MRPQSIRLSWLYIVAAIFIGGLTTSSLSAHEGRPVFLEITLTKDKTSQTIVGRWKIPPVLAGTDIPSFVISGENNAQVCGQNQASGPPSLRGRFKYICLPGENVYLNIIYPGHNPALTSLVLLTTQKDNQTPSQQQIFNGPDITTIALSVQHSFWGIAFDYISAGIIHILIGLDHLLFILCLLFIANSAKHLLWIITGFTLAHSVTLSLAALNLITINAALNETLIALSIFFLAVELERRRRNPSKFKPTMIFRYPFAVSTFFGLLHGVGFANVLADIGLPLSLKINALLFFNLGVEVGQILFITAALFLAFLITRARHYRDILSGILSVPVLKVSFFVIGVISAFWTIERLIIFLY